MKDQDLRDKTNTLAQLVEQIASQANLIVQLNAELKKLRELEKVLQHTLAHPSLPTPWAEIRRLLTSK